MVPLSSVCRMSLSFSLLPLPSLGCRRGGKLVQCTPYQTLWLWKNCNHLLWHILELPNDEINGNSDSFIRLQKHLLLSSTVFSMQIAYSAMSQTKKFDRHASCGVNKNFFLVSLLEIWLTRFTFSPTSQWLRICQPNFQEGYKIEVFIYTTGGANPKAD